MDSGLGIRDPGFGVRGLGFERVAYFECEEPRAFCDIYSDWH